MIGSSGPGNPLPAPLEAQRLLWEKEDSCCGEVFEQIDGPLGNLLIYAEQTNTLLSAYYFVYSIHICCSLSRFLRISDSLSSFLSVPQPHPLRRQAHHIWRLSHVPRFICVSCVSLTSWANSTHPQTPPCSHAPSLSLTLSLSRSPSRLSCNIFDV